MKFPAWMPAIVVALLLLLGSVFVVGEGQSALVLNLGKVVRSDIGPGLHFKLPMIESARVFDRRLMVLAAEPERYLTSEKKDVSVDFFAIGRIENVRDFYRATGGDESIATQRLAPIIKDALRNEINAHTLQQVVSGDRAKVLQAQLAAITARWRSASDWIFCESSSPSARNWLATCLRCALMRRYTCPITSPPVGRSMRLMRMSEIFTPSVAAPLLIEANCACSTLARSPDTTCCRVCALISLRSASLMMGARRSAATFSSPLVAR